MEAKALNDLAAVLARLKKAQERWCAEEIDDAEEMWIDIPEMLDVIVPKLAHALAALQPKDAT